jgi:hypothetical protein
MSGDPCRGGPCGTLCTETTVFSGAAKSQDSALALLVIRRGFGFRFVCAAFSFAQRSLLVLPFLFFLGPCACCSLSFSPVSPVVWLECHEVLSCGGLISYLPAIYMVLFKFACPCYLSAQGTSRDNVKSDARLLALSGRSQMPIELTYDVVSERGRFAASNLQNGEPVPGWGIRPGPATGDLDMAGRAAMTVMPLSMCGETIVDQ